ncbi:MAG: amidohydrolase family protein [Deltaproteobacteria bacterium]|nr:amidohydrolase family protein [Deltaproteobacteria bacterium]
MIDDYFVMASECHLMPHRTDLNYYPRFKHVGPLIERLGKLWIKPDCRPEDMPQGWLADDLIKAMDEADIDVGTALRESMMDFTGWASCFSTNGWIMEQIEKYKDRLFLEANVGPILKRGVKEAIWEMEYLVKERNAKLIKVYQCEDIGPLNAPAMWPFYEKAAELGVPLTVHTGLSYVWGQPTKNNLPIHLEDVLRDFPDLNIIAYHMGWPDHEQLFGMTIPYGNLYIGLSGIVGWFVNAPYRGYHLIGEAIQYRGGADRLVFGLDWPCVNPKACVDYIKNLDMPDELVEKWGYRKITEQDKRMILGETLAGLTNVEVRKRSKNS